MRDMTARDGADPMNVMSGEAGGVKRALEDADLERLAGLLLPLSSPVRLRLLRFLTTPHYLEEVASHLKLTRQAARKHLDKLVAIGVLDRKPGTRDTGPVTEYVINPQALFLVYDEFEKLGSLRRDERSDVMLRTVAEPGVRSPAAGAAGPCMWIVRGLNIGLRAALPPKDGREWVIGRDVRCDLVVAHDPYASNRHAEIRRENGAYVLTDLRSTNGTKHNWALVARGGEVPLRHGDLVGVGKTLLLFWDAG